MSTIEGTPQPERRPEAQLAFHESRLTSDAPRARDTAARGIEHLLGKVDEPRRIKSLELLTKMYEDESSTPLARSRALKTIVVHGQNISTGQFDKQIELALSGKAAPQGVDVEILKHLEHECILPTRTVFGQILQRMEQLEEINSLDFTVAALSYMDRSTFPVKGEDANHRAELLTMVKSRPMLAIILGELANYPHVESPQGSSLRASALSILATASGQPLVSQRYGPDVRLGALPSMLAAAFGKALPPEPDTQIKAVSEFIKDAAEPALPFLGKCFDRGVELVFLAFNNRAEIRVVKWLSHNLNTLVSDYGITHLALPIDFRQHSRFLDFAKSKPVPGEYVYSIQGDLDLTTDANAANVRVFHRFARQALKVMSVHSYLDDSNTTLVGELRQQAMFKPLCDLASEASRKKILVIGTPDISAKTFVDEIEGSGPAAIANAHSGIPTRSIFFTCIDDKWRDKSSHLSETLRRAADGSEIGGSFGISTADSPLAPLFWSSDYPDSRIEEAWDAIIVLKRNNPPSDSSRRAPGLRGGKPLVTA